MARNLITSDHFADGNFRHKRNVALWHKRNCVLVCSYEVHVLVSVSACDYDCVRACSSDYEIADMFASHNFKRKTSKELK